MATLSGVTQVTRKILEWLGIGVAAIVILFLLVNLFMFLKNIFAPTPPPPPSVAFGKLSLPALPKNSNVTPYTYSINTLTGKLPSLPDRITVYKLQQPKSSLLNLNKAKTIAGGAGFFDDPIALSEINYRWVKNDPIPGILTMDIQSFDFTYATSYLTDATVLTAAYLPGQMEAQTASKQFFDALLPLPTSIDPAKTKITFFAIKDGQLTPATSQSTAQIIRIDYFPQNLDNLPIYTQNPDRSLLHALVASTDTTVPQVVEASFYHKNVGDKATYPIISAEVAYDMLKKGEGFIAANPSGSTTVTITNVSLGYYVDVTPQAYLLPIIVFQGDQGFFAYVSAVKGEWVQK